MPRVQQNTHWVFNFLVPLNKSAHNHHSVDYRGSNYLHLKMVSASNTTSQIFLSKSHNKEEQWLHLTFLLTCEPRDVQKRSDFPPIKMRILACMRKCVLVCAPVCSHVNDEYVSAMSSDSPSRGRDPQTEYTTGTDTAYSQTMSIAQG